MKNWALWMATKEGQTLCSLDMTLGFEFLRVANAVGTFEIVMPPDAVDEELLTSDNRIEIWRMFPGVSTLAFTGVVRGWKWKTDKTGQTTLTISGSCINHLLKRRVLYRGFTT